MKNIGKTGMISDLEIIREDLNEGVIISRKEQKGEELSQ